MMQRAFFSIPTFAITTSSSYGIYLIFMYLASVFVTQNKIFFSLGPSFRFSPHAVTSNHYCSLAPVISSIKATGLQWKNIEATDIWWKNIGATDICRTATWKMYIQGQLPRQPVATACYGKEPKSTRTMDFAEKILIYLLFPDVHTQAVAGQAKAKPWVTALAWPRIWASQSCLRPSQSRGFQAKPGQKFTNPGAPWLNGTVISTSCRGRSYYNI